jgi:hypothetical protein
VPKFHHKSQSDKERSSYRWKCFSKYEGFFLSTIDELCSILLENMKYLPTHPPTYYYLPTHSPIHQLLTPHLHTYQSAHSAFTHPLTFIPTWLPTHKHRPYLSSYLPTYLHNTYIHTYIINRYQQAHKSTRLNIYISAYLPIYKPTFLSLWRQAPFWPMATRFFSSWITFVDKWQDLLK